jgi:nucleoside-diphosphate-sugar epimerase
MRVLVSGATGIVGRFVVEHLLAHGHAVVAGVRRMPDALPFSRHVDARVVTLDPDADHRDVFGEIDGFVHAAFDHVPGRYRGGEGDNPEAFRHTNLDGSVRLFSAARAAGVERCVFLSSRAVYAQAGHGRLLNEDTEPAPESLYGIIKLEGEQALFKLNTDDFTTASLRATGVYGLQPGLLHKWELLARDYLAGLAVEDRVGTEVHGIDLAEAVRLLLTEDAALVAGRAFNASDLLTSHHDVLSELQQATGSLHPLPAPLDKSAFEAMDTQRLRSLGWQPGGFDRLRADIAALGERLNGA